MITSSHRMIGEFLLRYIRENGGVELDREGFLQGSTLPDFRAFYKSMPHEPSYWARYLQNEIGALSRLTRGLEPFGPAFSRRLGIVCHFYADFFCFPHTAGYPDGLIRHLRYEWALNSRLPRRAAVCRHQKNRNPGSGRPGREADIFTICRAAPCLPGKAAVLRSRHRVRDPGLRRRRRGGDGQRRGESAHE